MKAPVEHARVGSPRPRASTQYSHSSILVTILQAEPRNMPLLHVCNILVRRGVLHKRVISQCSCFPPHDGYYAHCYCLQASHGRHLIDAPEVLMMTPLSDSLHNTSVLFKLPMPNLNKHTCDHERQQHNTLGQYDAH